MKRGNWHFVGIGGIGMSALARVLVTRGETVSGSDLKATPLIEQLRSEGAHIMIGHSGRNVAGAHTVVVSSAIDRANPELIAARDANIPVMHRGELLARLANERQTIAICGTHGKTTTTAMMHAIARRGGIDAGLMLGGIDTTMGTNAHDGSSPWFITEADESDGSFALISPTIAVITNLENDHLASDDDLPQLVRGFAEFLAKLPADGAAIQGADKPHTTSLAALERVAPTLTFGLSPHANVHAADLRFRDLGSAFEVIAGGVPQGTVELSVPGTINVENALAAIAVARRLEIPFSCVTDALREFGGVRRRFEILTRGERVTIVDDYAHHPTAVRETIAAARQFHPGPLYVAFQPHRYSRTAYLAHDFASALAGADRVYLAPVYAASEPMMPGVSERSIGEPLRGDGTDVAYVESVEALVPRLLDEAPPGSLVLMLGAGNITDVAAELASRVNARAPARV